MLQHCEHGSCPAFVNIKVVLKESCKKEETNWNSLSVLVQSLSSSNPYLQTGRCKPAPIHQYYEHCTRIRKGRWSKPLGNDALVRYRLLAGSFFLILLLFPFVCCFPRAPKAHRSTLRAGLFTRLLRLGSLPLGPGALKCPWRHVLWLWLSPGCSRHTCCADCPWGTGLCYRRTADGDWKSSCLPSPRFLIGRSPTLHWKCQVFVQDHVPLPAPSSVPHPLKKTETVPQLLSTLEKRHIFGTAFLLAPVLWVLWMHSPSLLGQGVNWRRDARAFSKFPYQFLFCFTGARNMWKHTEMSCTLSTIRAHLHPVAWNPS